MKRKSDSKDANIKWAGPGADVTVKEKSCVSEPSRYWAGDEDANQPSCPSQEGAGQELD